MKKWLHFIPLVLVFFSGINFIIFYGFDQELFLLFSTMTLMALVIYYIVSIYFVPINERIDWIFELVPLILLILVVPGSVSFYLQMFPYGNIILLIPLISSIVYLIVFFIKIHHFSIIILEEKKSK